MNSRTLTYIIAPNDADELFAKSIKDFLLEVENEAANLEQGEMIDYVWENHDALQNYVDCLRWQLLDRTKYIEALEQELARALALLP
jgi:hypothetical protein